MGPLHGLKIVEIAGIGPGQYCGMLLADMGADLIRIVRPEDADPNMSIRPEFNLMNRGRPAITVDLKSPEGVELLLGLCEKADAMFEGFRPGVMEKLGLGPDDCMSRNKRLVYGRMTGYGQDGPLAQRAGHDTNYIALSGALHAIGDRDRPPPMPLNLIGDFGGGGVFLAMGLLAAIIEATRSGEGQVVDAAMVDGAASMLTLFHGLMADRKWQDSRQSNLLDGGAPFARVYETADNRYISVCALEGRFFAELLQALDITEFDPAEQYRPERWPELHSLLEEAFRSKTRDQWSNQLEQLDCCAMPVLSMTEAPLHAHNVARNTFVDVDGVTQPGPAPRFSRTQSQAGPTQEVSEELARETALRWGLSDTDVSELL